MNKEIPDKWCLVRVNDELVKVIATWSGGYLDGDSWKINSGIKNIESTGDDFLITGYSGSIYQCRKKAYGITTYGASILKSAGLQPMEEAQAINYINNYETRI